jgi:crotonobetainyl-CoA:carnitine CoA-transferase CaiB-like acyl-CoA transferase
MLIHAGNTQDIKSSLQHGFDKYSIADLRENIEAEKAGQNRSTVIKMLEAAISKKYKEAGAGPFQPKELPIEEILKTVKELSDDASLDAWTFLQRKNQPPRIKRIKLEEADFWFTINKLLNSK